MVAANALLLAVAGLVAAAASASSDVITNDTYFYGQSPPVYPSRTCFMLHLKKKDRRGETNSMW